MEQRKNKRVHFVCKAFVTTGVQTYRAMTDNISIDGLYLQTNCTFPIGETVGIVWSQCTESPVYVDCIVVRHDKNGLAVKFKSADHDSLTMIGNIVNSQPPSMLAH